MASASEAINAKLEAWSKTKAEQKVLAAAGKKALLGAIRNGEKPKDADKLADEMKTVLLAHLPDSLKSLTMSDFEEPEFKITDDEAVMIIRFLSDSVSRPSLDPEKYPNGIADIVVHLDHGWDAKRVTGGLWHGEYHLSRQHVERQDFLQDAVDEFNRAHPESEAKVCYPAGYD